MDATDTQHEATDEAAISPSPAHVRSGEANAGVPNEATVAPFHPPALGVNEAKKGQMGPVLEPPRRELTWKQELAMPHILAAQSERDGARAAQISRNTLQRWMDNPSFRAELEDQPQSRSCPLPQRISRNWPSTASTSSPICSQTPAPTSGSTRCASLSASL